jgi:hypothetical protein
MLIIRRSRWAALAAIFTFILATGCTDDKDDPSAEAPAVESVPQADPEAMRQAVDRAVERRLAEVEAERIGGEDGDAARIRALEARLARTKERLDSLERKESLEKKGDQGVGTKEPLPQDKTANGKPLQEGEDDSKIKPLPQDDGSEEVGDGEPLPQVDPDVVEAPVEDVIEEPAEADMEPALGFTPAPLPEDEDDADAPTLILTRAAVAPSVDRESREPSEPGTIFDASVGKLYAFMVFKNLIEEEQQVTVIWKRNGIEFSRLPDLSVGPMASRWRTWAYVTVNERRRGDWTVEILGTSEALLGTLRFKVE